MFLCVLSSHDGGGRVEGEDDCDGRGGAGHGDGHLVLAPRHVVLAAGARVTRYMCHEIHVSQDTRAARVAPHLYGHWPPPPAPAMGQKVAPLMVESIQARTAEILQ